MWISLKKLIQLALSKWLELLFYIGLYKWHSHLIIWRKHRFSPYGIIISSKWTLIGKLSTLKILSREWNNRRIHHRRVLNWGRYLFHTSIQLVTTICSSLINTSRHGSPERASALCFRTWRCLEVYCFGHWIQLYALPLEVLQTNKPHYYRMVNMQVGILAHRSINENVTTSRHSNSFRFNQSLTVVEH
jgi:hypothetical protein